MVATDDQVDLGGNPSPTQSVVQATVVGGTQYFIQVGEYASGAAADDQFILDFGCLCA